MTDENIPGAMTMVKINGEKVKLLRENQGLTQLYLATAVQVTTDTISRWENRRYPSIKKENGLNLAEALGVELEELLESPARDISPSFKADSQSSVFKKFWPLALLAATLIAIFGGFGYYLIIATSSVPLTAKRSLPAHCIKGQPFPVIITVTGASSGSTALIIKEGFPENATILKTLPDVNAAGLKNKRIKWLQKIEKSAIFSYVLTIDDRNNEELLFGGSVATNSNSSNLLPITGDVKISLSKYHWADSDGDNIISDNEILTVYDRYSEIEGLGLNIDLIEDIWLGSGYKWDQKTSSYKIFE